MINEFVEPGHFYSVIPKITKEYNNNEIKFINLDFNEESHLQILEELNSYLTDFDETFGISIDNNLNENIIKKQNDLSNEISSELNNFNSLSLSFNKNSTSKSVISEDDVLVYSTPTKVGENFKFGRRSPNASSRMNLMNLFKQIKGEK